MKFESQPSYSLGQRTPASREVAVGENGGNVTLVSQSALGAINRGRVLQALYDNGPKSRADLARLAGVNRTTITGIVQPMIEDQLLIEGDASPSDVKGGKPARPLYFNPDAPMLGAVLLLPGTIQTCLVALTGEIKAVAKAEFDTHGDTEAFIAVMAETLTATLSQAQQAPFGIGVASAGMIDSDNGTILTVNLAPVLTGLPLVAILQERFSLPVAIDHHPRALLVGDRWFGPGRGQQNFAAVYTGEVLGGAFFIDGKVYRGLAGSGGELGHTVVQIDGAPCNCGKHGCWETVAALPWLRKEAARMGLPHPKSITCARLVKEADEGSNAAEELLVRYTRNVAFGIVNLQQTLSLNSYVLHGDVAGGGMKAAELIRQHVEQLVVKRPGQEISITVNGIGEGHTALRGAAGLVLSSHLKLVI
ncbi:ROK family transcriptional regulator [Rhizobium laguerreae]|uniref:ROK family transcriptional regulator n=1 Tax=Rhizobium laguerreae TaxID=1076926 RepID=UPI001C919EC7|nr:ROK family transcriptional regulator [Rhizobium laguerreae]MBY3074888.1 ROK family transcriptional regulator [Rhizobium laguerreae]MBY3081777.1 ROK family transcriptional regulator [Rhizobium laguerreae]MBY3088717.1 ROK family transcriptional regulator [Rhizobium laguerreae]MBY3109523.1 ROK family transcriptional regulator [Rhizobium laguerreae]MBY3129678.1 ROK family transcriptional regulator [Rhizobium laguerreae]